MGANVVMANSMHTATKAMHTANQQMNPKQMQKVMTEFERQNEISNMTEEMMDEAFADDEVEEESSAVINEIFDEIGIESTKSLKQAPNSNLPSKQQTSSKNKDEQEADELLSRLANLRN